jgi:cell division protein FtsQ
MSEQTHPRGPERAPHPLPGRLPEVPAADETPPFLRPRTRTRVRRVRRGWSGRLALALQVGAAALVLAVAVWSAQRQVLGSERLQVSRVDVRGSRFLSEGEVRELLGPAVGENILTLDIAALVQRLQSSPWVADATVRRTLPDTVEVEIHERVPLALAEVERLYLMDGQGVLIDIYGPHTSEFDLPIVRGLKGVDGETRRDRAQRAGVLLADLGELAVEVSEVIVEPSGDLRVVLREAGTVLRLGAPPYRGRFETFLGLRQELLARAPSAEYFDLRFEDRIYAKHRGPEAMPAPAPAMGGR